MVAMPEFQPLQRVRVREEGGASISLPDTRFLGKEGTIQYGTGGSLKDPPTFYVVEFDTEEVFAISPDWLEPAVILRNVKEEGIE